MRRIGPGPERDRVAQGLRSLAAGAPNVDVKALEGRTPWLRLRTGEWRFLFRPAGERLWVERIVNRRDLEQAIRTLR